ncbi:MAG: hypothetical protein WDO68_17290 [Gammaproteobacteria bacterium]
MPRNVSRRQFVRQTVSAAVAATTLGTTWGTSSAATAARKGAAIAALLPRDPSGHQFVLYSDCTVTGKNTRSTDALNGISQVIQRLDPQPQFIAFPGDAVGAGGNANEWEFFLEQMAWVRKRGIPLYQSTSNHNAHNFQAEANFRKYHPDLPMNGPGDQQGLAYWLRRGNLLYISVHHPVPNENYRPGFDFGDLAWVDDVLARNADAAYKLVAGHYPVFRINGYTGMSIPHESREPFWSVLRKHHVNAYLTSHVLAFDVQVRDGILQICSGGAGPNVMPAETEGTHAVQIALDRQGVRYQVLNLEGNVRESLVWPFIPPEDVSYQKDKHWLPIESGNAVPIGAAPDTRISLYRISGLSYFANPDEQRVDLLEGKAGDQRTLQAWVDLLSLRLYVTLEIEGVGTQHWIGPVIDFRKGPMDVQLAFHPGMGPGGVLWRWNDSSPWSSMETTTAHGLEALKWPQSIAKVGLYAGSGANRREIQYTVLRTEMPLPKLTDAA